MYITMCSCGAEIRSITKEGKCKKCGEAFKLEWPGEVVKVKDTKTISEEYDESKM